jgi:hypothetical protein
VRIHYSRNVPDKQKEGTPRYMMKQKWRHHLSVSHSVEGQRSHIYWKEKETHVDFDFGNFNNYQQNKYSVNFRHTSHIIWPRNGWQPLQRKCLRNQSIRTSLQLRVNDTSLCGLRAIRPAFLGLVRTILDLTMHSEMNSSFYSRLEAVPEMK